MFGMFLGHNVFTHFSTNLAECRVTWLKTEGS